MGRLGISIDVQRQVVKNSSTTKASSRADALKAAILAAKAPLEDIVSVGVGKQTHNESHRASGCVFTDGQHGSKQEQALPAQPSEVHLNDHAIQRFYDKIIGGSADISSKITVLRKGVMKKAHGLPP